MNKKKNEWEGQNKKRNEVCDESISTIERQPNSAQLPNTVRWTLAQAAW